LLTTMSGTDVHGTVADGFGQVREAFAATVAEQDGQVGAQLTAYAHGRQVVDLWARPRLIGLRDQPAPGPTASATGSP
jgi:hypothetical protein